MPVSLNDFKQSKVDETYEDNSIQSSPQDGKVITRRKFTKTRKKFSVELTTLTNEQATNLKSFYLEHEITVSFSWTNQADNVLYTVRFEKPVKIKKSARFDNYYTVDTIQLVEV